MATADCFVATTGGFYCQSHCYAGNGQMQIAKDNGDEDDEHDDDNGDEIGDDGDDDDDDHDDDDDNDDDDDDGKGEHGDSGHPLIPLCNSADDEKKPDHKVTLTMVMILGHE